MPENNWVLNDSFPNSLAQQFAAAPGEWSGVVFWGLFEQAFSGTTNVDVTVVITGLALGVLQLGDEIASGDANTAAAGLALGAIALGDESVRGDAVVLVTGFGAPAALGDEAVAGDAISRPAGLATGDVAIATAAVTGDSLAVLVGFDAPALLGDEDVRVDAIATASGLTVDFVAVGDSTVSGDASTSIVGLSTGAIASGEQPIEEVVPQPPSLWGAVRRMFGGSDVIREQNARIEIGRGFVVPLELGRVRVTVEQSRSTITSVAGFSTGKIKLGLVTAAGEDNVTDEELLLILAAA